jgi:hypothetical protein
VENLAETAAQHTAPHLQEQLGDPGVFSATGMFGIGPGWYHLGTAADELFLGHPGEADFYIFDFGVMADGTARPQGDDVITQFERGLDGILILHESAQIAPGVSYSALAEGSGPHGGFDSRIDYSLVRLEFDQGVPIQMEIGSIGSLSFSEFV